MMEETWTNAYRLENYQVSSLGRIRRSETLHIKAFRVENGYNYISVSINGKQKRFRVCRLVLSSFCGPEPSLFARHLNGNSLDDRLTNLKWGTAKENANDRELHGTNLKGEQHGFSKLTDKQAEEILFRVLINRESASQVANDYPVCRQSIDLMVKGQTWKHIKRPIND